MQRYLKRGSDSVVQEVKQGLEAGDDPRTAMARVNRQIVEHQRRGEEVPASLLQLSKLIAIECISQSQGR